MKNKILFQVKAKDVFQWMGGHTVKCIDVSEKSNTNNAKNRQL